MEIILIDIGVFQPYLNYNIRNLKLFGKSNNFIEILPVDIHRVLLCLLHYLDVCRLLSGW